jgi:hypothetical protein
MAFRPSPPLLVGRLYRIRVIGDFIKTAAPGSAKGKAVDANHLPPYVPARKSGDCIEGGVFLSWFQAFD